MTKEVKEFIEDNIEAIEVGDWSQIIDLWYSSCANNFFTADVDFLELADVFKTAGINFMIETENIRKEFLYSIICQIIEDKLELAKFSGKSEIKKADISMQIDCNLGYTEEELDQLMEEVAVNCFSLKPDFTCFYLR
jgi:hypothetical protein